MRKETNQEIYNRLVPPEIRKKLFEEAEENSKPAQGFLCRVTQDINEATHWLAKEDEEIEGITPYTLYALVYHKYEDEVYLIDDSGKLGVEYLMHKGDYVVLEKVTR